MPVHSAGRVSTPGGIVSYMEKSTQERHPICVVSAGKALLREGVWLCTNEAVLKGSLFENSWIFKNTNIFEMR